MGGSGGAGALPSYGDRMGGSLCGAFKRGDGGHRCHRRERQCGGKGAGKNACRSGVHCRPPDGRKRAQRCGLQVILAIKTKDSGSFIFCLKPACADFFNLLLFSFFVFFHTMCGKHFQCFKTICLIRFYF